VINNIFIKKHKKTFLIDDYDDWITMMQKEKYSIKKGLDLSSYQGIDFF